MIWHENMPTEFRNQIAIGDMRVLGVQVPDASVDLIITDPPYPKEYIGLYGALAEMASRVLKPGGRCLALAGHCHVPEIITLMSKHLRYSWIISQIQGHMTSAIFPERVWASWKPCLVFRKEGAKPLGNFAMDCFRDTPEALNYAQTYHKWGQGAPFFAYYIDRWTEMGGIVLEPFAGGGTVPSVCKRMGRHYVAFEIDPVSAERARERVDNTQVPEPILMGEQPVLMEA